MLYHHYAITARPGSATLAVERRRAPSVTYRLPQSPTTYHHARCMIDSYGRLPAAAKNFRAGSMPQGLVQLPLFAISESSDRLRKGVSTNRTSRRFARSSWRDLPIKASSSKDDLFAVELVGLGTKPNDVPSDDRRRCLTAVHDHEEHDGAAGHDVVEGQG